MQRLPKILALGASTGGPQAVETILGLMGRPIRQAIFVIQHMPLGFTDPFARRLQRTLGLDVRECVVDGDVVEEGVVYVARSGRHLTLRKTPRGLQTRLSDAPESALHKPSIDVFLSSLASLLPDVSVRAAILTGMGHDGARGLRELRDKGGITAVQAELDCVVYGMPKAALAQHGATDALTLQELSIWASQGDSSNR
ncbi:MAG: CheB methylesterase domain-containing protein [Firmicutes bacterium]|nr:CheB methylesterase domain-containing protein [Bacillota bacterium]